MNQSDEEVIETLLHLRDAIFKTREKHGILRIDLEVLAFSKVKVFFTLYDLQSYYTHTNIQQIIRSLQRLKMKGYLTLMQKGCRNKPAYYSIANTGKLALIDYIGYTKAGVSQIKIISDRSICSDNKINEIRTKAFLRHRTLV